MALSFRDALTLAARFTDVKQAERGYHAVRVTAGVVEATNGVTGIVVEHDAEFDGDDVWVDAKKLLPIVRSATKPHFSTSRGTLTVKDGKSKSQLKGIAKGDRWEPVGVPTPAPWRSMTAEQAKALDIVAQQTSDKDDFTGAMRLTASWAGATMRTTICLAWIPHLVAEPVSMPPVLFRGVDEAGDILVHEGRVFVRSGGATRWALTVVTDWPDDGINTAVGTYRAQDHRVTVHTAPGALLDVLVKALAVAESKVDAALLTVDQGKLRIKLDGGVANFEGEVEASLNRTPAAPILVGVEPGTIQKVLKGLTAFVGGERPVFVSVSDNRSPVFVWSVEPVAIEWLSMAAFVG